MKNCSCRDWAFFILRIMLGSTFILHGAQKVFGAFGGPGLMGFAQWLAPMGVPMGLSYLAACSEFCGGLMIFFGVATELGALMGLVVMIGGIILVHLPTRTYFLQTGGFEYAFNLALVCIAQILGGAGVFALWDPFKKWRH